MISYWDTTEYRIWCRMRMRCQNSRDPAYKNYGGRGISVCEAWKRSFFAFLGDVGRRPSNKYSIDRVNNNGNYEPGNVRWATRAEQSRNTRRNVLITFRGETIPLCDWVSRLHLRYGLVLDRMLKLGWSAERALTEPVVPAPERGRRSCALRWHGVKQHMESTRTRLLEADHA